MSMMPAKERVEREEAQQWVKAFGLLVPGLLLALSLAGSPEQVWSATESSNDKPFRYDPQNRRDPFVPLVRDGRLATATAGQKIETSKPVLYGILWDPGGRSVALINNEEARVGDKVNEYLVKEIRQDAVVLASGGGEPFVLHITFEAASPDGAKQAATGDGQP